jgi:hypothetical protein
MTTPRLTLQSLPSSFWRHKNVCHPHPPYSSDLAPCGFFLSPKIKLKLKGRQFDTSEETQCLTVWQKTTSRKRSQNARGCGTGVYMREGTTSRVIAADRPYGEFYDFYSVSPEYFGYTLVILTANAHFTFSCIRRDDG